MGLGRILRDEDGIPVCNGSERNGIPCAQFGVRCQHQGQGEQW